MNYLPDETSPSSPAPAPSMSEAIVQQLRTLWHGVVRESECAARLERQQYWVLAATAAGPMRMSQLARHTQTSQASLTGIVDRMEDHGLVERLRSTQDRRVVDVSLTPAGREELARAQAIFSERLEATLSPLSIKERETFLSLLGKLNKASTWSCDLD